MTPLCTSATTLSPPTCGWALTSVAGPCVAQRVWPRPMLPGAGCVFQLGDEFVDAAGRFGDGEFAIVDRDDAAAIVAAILQAAQTFDQKIDCLMRPDIADDAAHRQSVLRICDCRAWCTRCNCTFAGLFQPTPIRPKSAINCRFLKRRSRVCLESKFEPAAIARAATS